MTVIQLLVSLVVLGVIMWLVNTYIPMEKSIKAIMNVVVVIAVVLAVLTSFGVIGPFSGMRIRG